MALKKEFSKDPDAKYAQELCSAHVLTEKMFMQTINTSPKINICSQKFLSNIHAAFYANLPKNHLYTHTSKGFTRIPVKAGVFLNFAFFTIRLCRNRRCPIRDNICNDKFSYKDVIIFTVLSHHKNESEKLMSPKA